jgi:hypothetical protein
MNTEFHDNSSNENSVVRGLADEQREIMKLMDAF